MKQLFMMGTKAYAGVSKKIDISRDVPDLCQVWDETKYYYIGAWEAGFGFMNVHFPKSTTRPLTNKEVDDFLLKVVEMPNGQCFRYTREQLENR